MVSLVTIEFPLISRQCDILKSTTLNYIDIASNMTV